MTLLRSPGWPRLAVVWLLSAACLGHAFALNASAQATSTRTSTSSQAASSRTPSPQTQSAPISATSSSSSQPADAVPAEAALAEARVHAENDRRSAARAAFERARGLFEAAGDRQGEARTLASAGVNLYVLGQHDVGLRQVRQAIDTLKAHGGGAPLAEAFVGLIGIMTPGAEKDAVRDEALAVARAAGARKEECAVLLSAVSDVRRTGVYTTAFQAANDALACYRQVPGEGRRGRVLNLLGLIDADHGQFEKARTLFQEALAFNEQAGDRAGAISSLSGLAAIAGALFEPESMRTSIERALAMAREMRAETLTPALGGQLGAFHVQERQFAEAKSLLDEALARETNAVRRVGFLMLSCQTETQLGHLAEAARACDEAVTLARREGPGVMMDALHWRGELRRARGDVAGATEDLAQGIVLAEEARRQSVPLDFMKRGFSEWQQELFTSSIALSMQTGDVRRALETAERARARSFLDLLATRDGDADADAAPLSTSMSTSTSTFASTSRSRPTSTSMSAAAGGGSSAGSGTAAGTGVGAGTGGGTVAATATATDSGSGGSRSAAASAVASRGSRRGGAAGDTSDSGLANDVVGVPIDLENSRSIDAPGLAEMTATARRLRSTLLVYWVSPDATFIWVVTPTGRVHAKQVDIAMKDLVRLVREARAPADAAAAGALTLMPSQIRPWRALYDRLVAPVRAFLPRTPGALLTIVPHGPLFQVSFAGLRDPQGRYLIESFRLHYTPAVGVLAYTARLADARAKAPAASRGGPLLVGDPGEVPGGPDGALLPALPWARREVESVAALFASEREREQPMVLVGDAATESAVRAGLADRSVLHFATHGIVASGESLSSFLALRGDAPGAAGAAGAAGANPAASNPAADGRLTADEVYGLRLNAELVVLSACGSGLGPTMTGDGVIGFTRAFLYARTSSVVATQWSVPDATSYEVMSRFYRERRAGLPVSAALRRAQLSTLAALRRGTLRAEGPTGPTVLAEHPVLWASFVLAGEP